MSHDRNGWKITATEILSRIKRLIRHNGWIKLLALLISIVFWAGLISQDETIKTSATIYHLSTRRPTFFLAVDRAGAFFIFCEASLFFRLLAAFAQFACKTVFLSILITRISYPKRESYIA